MKILLRSYEPECLCTSQQLMISKNVTFLISNANFKNVRDFVCNEMGVWKHDASPLKRFDVDKSTRSLKIIRGKANNPSSYILKRIYYENKSSSDLRKIVSAVIGTCEFNFIFEILSYNKTFIQLGLVQSVLNPLFDSVSTYFFKKITCRITMKICMKIASSFKKCRNMDPSHMIIVMMSSLF